MPISVKNVADMFNKDVFTAKGYYAGKVSDLEFDLSRFKVRSLVIEAARGSFLGKAVGGKKGVIIPYPMVTAIGDVVIIKHIATPTSAEEMTEESAAVQV
ncbi:MAG: PRC-barrel domain-containing protein [Candidatus Aenigmarchaeota archaeon]|nr:PRC-barrel domain-containing protein [Candidatus Aenigmarchaeota archaeon]